MTTIKISVKNKRDANLLYRMLMKLSIVDKVEKIEPEKINQNRDQYSLIKTILSTQANSSLFVNITNPFLWQKEIRNEWE